MIAAVRIALKDIRLRMRDRSAYIWGIAAPLGLAAIFSLVLGGVAGGGSLDVTYAVVDNDGGPISQGFVEALEAMDREGVFTIEFLTSDEDAESRVAAGDFDAALIVPAGFSAAVTSGGSAQIEVLGYVDSPIGSQVARAVADQFSAEVNGVARSVLTHFVFAGAPGPGDAEAVAATAAAMPGPLALDTAGEASKELSAGTFFAAAMAVFFLFFTVQFGVLGLIEEKEKGTMPRLLAAPIPRSAIVLGKVLTSFILGILSMTILVVATTWLPFMEADWGDSIGVAILVVSGVLSAMGVMMLVSAFARNAETAQSIQSIIAFVLGMLGGVFFPVGQAGGWLATATLFTPHAWFMRGLGDLAAGGGPADILPAAGYILLFGAVTAAIAMTRLRRTVTL